METLDSAPVSERRFAGDGESSPTPCEMCGERKSRRDLFPLHCDHTFCAGCIARHVSTAIGEQRRNLAADNGKITCPGAGCADNLAVDTCRQFLPADVVDAWCDVLCESLVSSSTKVWCPYENCSEMMVREGDGEVIEEAECPVCHRLFCARCDVPWHSGFGCGEFLKKMKKMKKI